MKRCIFMLFLLCAFFSISIKTMEFGAQQPIKAKEEKDAKKDSNSSEIAINFLSSHMKKKFPNLSATSDFDFTSYNLQVLYLAGTKIPTERRGNITKLYMKNHIIDQLSLPAIIAFIQTVPNLQKIHLKKCTIDSEGVRNICETLEKDKKRQTLEELKIVCPRFQANEIAIIAINSLQATYPQLKIIIYPKSVTPCLLTMLKSGH